MTKKDGKSSCMGYTRCVGEIPAQSLESIMRPQYDYSQHVQLDGLPMLWDVPWLDSILYETPGSGIIHSTSLSDSRNGMVI